MKLTYIAHACFQITWADGRVLVTDPYNDAVGYPVPRMYADMVTVSHDHFDHNYTDALTGPKAVIHTVGRHDLGNGLIVTGIETAHDDEGGAKRGRNIAFRMEAEDMTMLHLGDLGHMPNEAQCTAMQGADVVLMPVGGYFTIDSEMAVRVLQAIRPRLVIPMHYKTDRTKFGLDTERRFAELTGATYLHTSECHLTAHTLPDHTTVQILDPQ